MNVFVCHVIVDVSTRYEMNGETEVSVSGPEEKVITSGRVSLISDY